jgi:hypothetical protein
MLCHSAISPYLAFQLKHKALDKVNKIPLGKHVNFDEDHLNALAWFKLY